MKTSSYFGIRFSVIIPAFNSERFIAKCLESVLCQEYPKEKFEIIVVDDCSSDSQNDIIKKYACKYHNISILYHKHNMKQGGGRNTGLRVASGEYVMFLDSDDYWCRQDVFKTFDTYIRKDDKVEIIECISYFNSDSRDFQDKEIFNDLGYQTVSPSGYYTTKHHPCIWTSVYKKKLIETIPFREKVFYEDSDWKIKAYTSANRIGLLDYRFYVYYENVQSTVRKKSLNLFFDALEANILCRQAYRNSLLDDDVKQKKLLVSSTSVVRSIIAVRDYSVSDGIKILKAYRNSYYYHDIRKDIPIYSGIFFDILLRIPILLTLTVKAAIGFKRIFTNWVTDSNDSCPY